MLLVEDIKIEFADKPVTVYNFQVEDFHTYYVGDICVLVHNADYGKRHTPEQQQLVKEGQAIDKKGSVSRPEAESYVKRCRDAGFNKDKARIDEGHMQRMDPTKPMSGVSGKPHLHVPSGNQHSISIIN